MGFIKDLLANGRGEFPSIAELDEIWEAGETASTDERAAAAIEMLITEDLPSDWRWRLGYEYFDTEEIRKVAAQDGVEATPYIVVDSVVDGIHRLEKFQPSVADWAEARDAFYSDPRAYRPFRALAGHDVSFYSIGVEVICQRDGREFDTIDAGSIQIV